MDEMMEIIDFDRNAPIKCFLNRLGHSGRHWHDCLEILFVISGSSNVILSDKVFSMNEGDLLVINRNEMHEISSDDCTQIALQINDSFYSDMLPDVSSFRFQCNSVFQENDAVFDEMRHFIASLVKNNNDKAPGYQIQNTSLAYHLIYLLISNFLSNTKEYGTPKNAQRISELISIINAEYYTNLSLNNLSERMHLSVPYLSKYFKANTRSTFLAYLTDVRLAHTVNDLLSTNDPIEEIALRNGFSSNVTFLQAFKKNYDCLPSAYRRNSKQHQNETHAQHESTGIFSYMDLSHHNYLAMLNKYVDNAENRAHILPTVLPKNLHINIDSKHIHSHLTHNWRSFTSVGKAKELLYTDVQQNLSELQSHIHFEYIKFHGILSDDMYVYSQDTSGNPVYCFTYVDKILDFLLSIQLKPLIQLSFMPAALASDPSRTTFGFIVSPPKSISAWTSLVTAFTSHLIHRYGRQTVEQWPFCVWNEPDTPDMFSFGDDTLFYDFYRSTYLAVKDLDSRISFGTPSCYYIAQEEYRNFFMDFIPWCKEHGCPPDFINTHFYGTELTPAVEGTMGMAGNLTLSTDPDLFKKFIKNIRTMTQDMDMESLPIYLTEWNSSPSHQDLLGDTCYRSCYIVKNILENYDKLSAFGYWTLSDFLEEMMLPDDTFYGGLGIYTQNGIRKPAYYAFLFLNQLGDTLIKKGEHYFITRSDTSYQIILYNYKHFSNLYATGELFDMTPSNRYAPFSPEEGLNCDIVLENMPNGSYQLHQVSLNRSSGSAFDRWLAMGSPKRMNPQTVDLLNEISQPLPIFSTENVIDHELSLSVTLETQEVMLITITPLP